MKFWKILKSQIEQTLPEWRDQFLSYKDLKKQLKVMCPKDALTPPRLDADELNHFLRLLELEIDKFNAFFVDKEEEYIIKWKVTIYIYHNFLPFLFSGFMNLRAVVCVCVAGVTRQGCQSHWFKLGVDVTREGNCGFSRGDGFVRELYCTQLHRHALRAHAVLIIDD